MEWLRAQYLFLRLGVRRSRLINDDANLFRFWITEASERPARVACAIAHCTTPDEYRAALTKLRMESARDPWWTGFQ